MEVQRYASQPFPPYAFVPGESPHPTRDPQGHSYRSGPEPVVVSVTPDCWRESPDFLFGVDLYNAGFLWEAHEAWEGLWHVSKHDALQAQFIQGLIQCTAGCLKIRMGQQTGMRKLFCASLGRLRTVMSDGGSDYMGLDLATFVPELQAFSESDPSSPDDRPRLVLG